MSLDVSLVSTETKMESPLIYIRENGATRGITKEEWNKRFPDREPVVLTPHKTNKVYSGNITHNLGNMASVAGIYEALWHPDEIGITKAAQLVGLLTDGLERLSSNPEKFKAFNPANGWGDYDGLVEFVTEYLAACIANPDADVLADR